jgi:hypothetical protein
MPLSKLKRKPLMKPWSANSTIRRGILLSPKTCISKMMPITSSSWIYQSLSIVFKLTWYIQLRQSWLKSIRSKYFWLYVKQLKYMRSTLSHSILIHLIWIMFNGSTMSSMVQERKSWLYLEMSCSLSNLTISITKETLEPFIFLLCPFKLTLNP